MLHIFAGPVSYKVQCQLHISTSSRASIYLVHQNSTLRKWRRRQKNLQGGWFMLPY